MGTIGVPVIMSTIGVQGVMGKNSGTSFHWYINGTSCHMYNRVTVSMDTIEVPVVMGTKRYEFS